jgi:hypothetical protein
MVVHMSTRARQISMEREEEMMMTKRMEMMQVQRIKDKTLSCHNICKTRQVSPT